MKTFLIIISSFALGVLVALTDTSNVDAIRFLSIILSSPPVWFAVSVVAGYFYKTKTQSAFAAVASMTMLTLGYYVFGLTLGDRVGVGLIAITPMALKWPAIAIACGFIGGLAGYFVNTKYKKVPLLLLGSMFLAFSTYSFVVGYQWLFSGNNITMPLALLALGISGVALIVYTGMGRR